MTARKRSKTGTQGCGKAEAKTRLEDARQQLACAELHGKNSKPSERKARWHPAERPPEASFSDC